MSESQVIKNALDRAKKNQTDLLKELFDIFEVVLNKVQNVTYL